MVEASGADEQEFQDGDQEDQQPADSQQQSHVSGEEEDELSDLCRFPDGPAMSQENR